MPPQFRQDLRIAFPAVCPRTCNEPYSENGLGKPIDLHCEPSCASKVNLPIYLSPMPDPHNDNHHPLPVDAVYHAIVSDPNPKMVRLRLELLAAWRKGIL